VSSLLWTNSGRYPRTPSSIPSMIGSSTARTSLPCSDRSRYKSRTLPTSMPRSGASSKYVGNSHMSSSQLSRMRYVRSFIIRRSAISELRSLGPGHLVSVVKADPHPIMQKLHLLELPPEILLNLMEFVPANHAVVLTATCHQLRTLALATAFSVCQSSHRQSHAIY